MELYVKVEWPESQVFQSDEYNDQCYWTDNMVVFVPESLYYEVVK